MARRLLLLGLIAQPGRVKVDMPKRVEVLGTVVFQKIEWLPGDRILGVLRVDVLAHETAVPLVAVGKLGLGSALWWSGSGDDTSTDASGVEGRGISYGWQMALGGMLLLDALDRDAALGMDSGTGVNNSYLFAEWYFSRLDGFGSGKVMEVGANTWVLGLALEI